MDPFIPEEDEEAFKKYLQENDLEPVTESRSRSSTAAAAGPSGGSKRKGAQQGHVANIDKFLHDIDSQMDNVLEDTTNF